MRAGLILVALAIWAGAAAARSPSPAVGPSDLYFLAVGAANHRDPDYGALRAARDSAHVVARALADAGARYGIVLTSRPGGDAYLTRDDVIEALGRLKDRIRADGTRTPRVVVYVMSHGAGDPANRYLFLAPDNLAVQEKPLKRDLEFRLARRSIFNFDLLAALMSFRLDDRLAHLDRDVESSQMSDKLGLAGIRDQAKKQGRRSAELDRIAGGFGPRPLDNAPIPFVLLLDNCADGVETNLVDSNPLLDLMIGTAYAATLDVGRAFYAVRPGLAAAPLALPDHLADPQDLVPSRTGAMVPPFVGPLAVHLKNVLFSRDKNAPMTLAAFAQDMARSGSDSLDDPLPSRPHAPAAQLRADVGRAEFIPAAPRAPGGFDRMDATGRSVVACCRVID